MKYPSKIREKRIDFKENFELCYLRHQYMRRIKRAVTREEMRPYNKIVDKFAKNTFYVYKNLFMLVGMDVDDVVNIAQVHLVSFLGLFAVEMNKEALECFKQIFKKKNFVDCSEENLLSKNKANFTCFLKQRMEDVVRVCRQKAKNIRGFSAEEFAVFKGTKMPPHDIEDLLEDYKKYNYRPMSTTTFKSILKNIKHQEGPVYVQDDIWYVCVPIRKKNLTLTDFTCHDFDPYQSEHNLNPEQVFEVKQEKQINDRNHSKFNSFSKKEKARMIKLFVNNNRKNPKLKEEVEIACNLLERLK